jgi:uncharacterized protein (UPF0261 family)
VPHHINDPAFAEAAIAALDEITGNIRRPAHAAI